MVTQDYVRWSSTSTLISAETNAYLNKEMYYLVSLGDVAQEAQDAIKRPFLMRITQGEDLLAAIGKLAKPHVVDDLPIYDTPPHWDQSDETPPVSYACELDPMVFWNMEPYFLTF